VPDPDDEADEVDPRDALTPDEWIDRLANALHRADLEGHGRFENAIDAGNWLWEEEEDLVWRRLNDNDQTLAFQEYERVRDEHTALANDPLGGWGGVAGDGERGEEGEGAGAAGAGDTGVGGGQDVAAWDRNPVHFDGSAW
jgi:hypothetical protein